MTIKSDGPLQCCCACRLWAVGCWLGVVAAVAMVAVVALVAVVAAAAFGAAGNGGSSSGAGAKKRCCCQCISATGVVGTAGVGTDVVL